MARLGAGHFHCFQTRLDVMHPFDSQITPTVPSSLMQRVAGLPPARIAVVNAGSVPALTGIRDAADAGLAEPILIGNPKKIHATAEQIAWDINGLRIIEAPKETAAPEAARLAREGEADAIMKGQIHTSIFLKGLLPSRMGLRSKEVLCGHVMHITRPGDDRPLIMTDVAMNVAPRVALRQACLGHAITLARAVGIEAPKVALLAPTEDVMTAVPSTQEAADIAQWCRSTYPDLDVAGPISMDLALSSAAAQVKGYENPVAGAADIMVVPEITSGNALFKLMVLGMGACAAGLVMGCKVPILLTSRAQGPAARLASVALGALLARAG